jgi:hypothetical protein
VLLQSLQQYTITKELRAIVRSPNVARLRNQGNVTGVINGATQYEAKSEAAADIDH